MAETITYGQLQVNCRFKFIKILHCNIHAKYGEHTRAKIVGTVESSEAKALFPDVNEEKLEISSRNGNNKRILFVGIMKNVELEEEGQYAQLSVEAVSYTWKMDIERKSRSFQNLSMTYKDIVNKVIQKYRANLTWNIPDKQLEYPLIQYKETDYCFIKRILSHLGASVIIQDYKETITFDVYPGGGKYIQDIDLQGKTYSVVLFRDKKLRGYVIDDMDFMQVGDALSIQEKTYYIMESESDFQNNVLNCRSLIFPKQGFKVEKIPAHTLKGAVITGKVLEAKQEMLKLHLDIDREQIEEEAYDFPWKPITGNLLYCMPEKGSKVALYLGGEEEKNAAVIYNIRENGEVCEEFADYNERYFTTEHEKRMYLNPSNAGFLNMNKRNAEVSLNDKSFVQIKSQHHVSVMAEGQIELRGKKITITAPKEATLVKRDMISPTVINMCNAFDAIGATGNFMAIPQEVKAKRKRTGCGQAIEKYSLSGMVENVLSNIPAEEMKNPAMEAVAGSMPVISRLIR